MYLDYSVKFKLTGSKTLIARYITYVKSSIISAILEV